MAIRHSRVSGPAGACPIQSVTMQKVREIARQWALTRSLPMVETEWTALLYAERRAGRLSNQASSGSDLKALLAPFKQRLEDLRERVEDANRGLGGKSRGTTGHGVYSQARGLPGVGGGGPGGEPAPTMGDLSSLGGPGSKDEDDDEVVDRLTYLAKKILGKRK